MEDPYEAVERAIAALDEAFARGKRARIRELFDVNDALPPGEAGELWMAALEAWRVHDTAGKRVVEARRAATSYAKLAGDAALDDLYAYWVEILDRGGNIKDWSLFSALARRAGRREVLDEPELGVILRRELPDVWVKRAVARGAYDEAVACFFEHEGHPRLRLAAPTLLKRCGPEEVDVMVACRMSLVEHYVRRGGRRRYRKACQQLGELRRELDRAGEPQAWHYVVEDVTGRWARRPALLDELEKAGIT